MFDIRDIDLFVSLTTGSRCLQALTLLINPFILFRSASQLSLWYSALVLSFAASACIALSLAGGIYAPPLRDPRSFANSARAVASPPPLVVAIVPLDPPIWFGSEFCIDLSFEHRSFASSTTSWVNVIHSRCIDWGRGRCVGWR